MNIPDEGEDAVLRVNGREVALTNLNKVFFAKAGLRKRDVLQYYADVAPVLIPHVADRPIVMKRYPNGVGSPFFFMKRAPAARPPWIRVCSIEHASGNVIDFALIDDPASLLWMINLGCIDLNPWYCRCGDLDHPDVVVFDLDPVKAGKRGFDRVRDAALAVRERLVRLGLEPYVKTSGSAGMHVYVPIRDGLDQKGAWRLSKQIAVELAETHPDLLTAEYRIAKRPAGRILIDYNQNAWGRTLASVYSLRPTPGATVSTPLAWDEVERGIEIDDFRIDNVPDRVRARGDLWASLP